MGFWQDKELIELETFSTKHAGVEAVLDLTAKYKELLGLYQRPKVILIESVEVWASSAKSMASAARGNLSLLAYIVGGFITASPCNVALVSPLKWKGQLPYDVLRKILKESFGIDCSSTHAASAVGIGLHYYGKL